MWKLQRKINRYRSFFFPIGLLCVLFLIPTFNYLSSVYDEISEVKDKVELLKQKLSILNKYSETVLNDYLTESSAAVPVDKSIPSLFTTVDSVGQKASVILSKFSIPDAGALSTESAKLIAQEERQFGANILPFEVTVLGSLDQLRDFFRIASSVRRFISAKSFRLNFTEGDIMSTSVSFNAYYSLLPSTSPGALSSLSSPEKDILDSVIKYERLDNIIENNSFPGQTKQNPFGL